jgi:sec-independent protein translocase protein TatC
MIVAAFVIAAVATPPDVISQLMLAVPLILLFEGSLLVMWFLDRKSAKEREPATAAAQGAEPEA